MTDLADLGVMANRMHIDAKALIDLTARASNLGDRFEALKNANLTKFTINFQKYEPGSGYADLTFTSTTQPEIERFRDLVLKITAEALTGMFDGIDEAIKELKTK